MLSTRIIRTRLKNESFSLIRHNNYNYNIRYLASLAATSNEAPPSFSSSSLLNKNNNNKIEHFKRHLESKSKNKIGTLTNNNDSELLSWLRSYNKNNKTAFTLSSLYKYAVDDISNNQRIRNAQFLHRELQIRIADRALDLLTLPNGLSTTRQIRNVAHTYINLLRQLHAFKVPKTHAEERQFTVLLSEMVLDRTSIPHGIAKGLQSLKDRRRETLLDSARLQQVEDALCRFFTARVGLRFLMEHHILTDKNSPEATLLRKQHACHLDDECTLFVDDQPNAVGCIQNNCDPVKEIQLVVKQVTRLCMTSFGMAPPIELVDCCTSSSKHHHFCYLPHHLRYMVAELLKNSCKATINNFHNNNLATIKIIVVKGDEDVTIKIADRGGGVSRSQLENIWTFTKSTLLQTKTLTNPDNDLSFTHNSLSGTDIREFGLPLARIYARYFGGEITLKSCEGVGLDAYLYLPVLGEACENLPDKVATSPGNLDSTISYNDQDTDTNTDAYTTNTDINTNNIHQDIDALCQRAL